jgi:tetratricopeptide (TPR) repeat protein
MEYYDKALKIDPKNAGSWYNKGEALSRLRWYTSDGKPVYE